MQSSNTDVKPAAGDLTPEQQRAWEDTLTALRWKAPAFSHLMYKMLACDHNQGNARYVAVMNREHPWAWTDAKNIGINPDNFFSFGLMGRVFILGHEVMHNVYGDVERMHHCRTRGEITLNDGTKLPWDEFIGQKAADLRINALLLKSRIGEKPVLARDVTMPDGEVRKAGETVGHYDPNMDGTEAFADVYEQEYKKKKQSEDDGDGPAGGEGQQGQGGNPGGFDQTMPPGQSTGQQPSEAARERNEQAWQVAIAAAQAIQKMQGNMPAALERAFKEILEPEVYWLDHIEALIRRSTGSGGTTWNQPDPWFIGRDIYLPSKTGFGAGHIVVWGDTSGSRDDREIASNIAELKGIMEEVRPERITILWCDAKVQNVDEIEDPTDLEHVRPKGGGGTSLAPIWKWIADQHEDPELFIGFTDGYVDFPKKEPRFPVIWANTTKGKDYPFGKVVDVNQKPSRL